MRINIEGIIRMFLKYSKMCASVYVCAYNLKLYFMPSKSLMCQTNALVLKLYKKKLSLIEANFPHELDNSPT